MVDAFPFFNELDILEIRLNILAPYIDRFVLAECSKTHSGNDKPLYFQENKDRFKQFNIEHIIIPPKQGNPWELEEYGREYLLGKVNPDEIVLISDVDEIPDLKNYRGEEGVFKHKVYTYYLNCYTGIDNWGGTFAVKGKNIDRFCIEKDLRVIYKRKARVVGSGWHFSSIGSKEQIKYKLESFAHQELNTPDYKAKIMSNLENLTQETPEGLSWLEGKYPKLWLK